MNYQEPLLTWHLRNVKQIHISKWLFTHLSDDARIPTFYMSPNSQFLMKCLEY